MLENDVKMLEKIAVVRIPCMVRQTPIIYLRGEAGFTLTGA